MKRILSLIMIVVILVSFCVPVSASSVDSISESQWLNVMPFFETNVNYSPTNNTWFRATGLPSEHYHYYDIIFQTDEPAPAIGTPTAWLTIYYLGDNLWRAYGSGTGTLSRTVEFYFVNQTGTYVQIVACNAFIGARRSYPDIGKLTYGSTSIQMEDANSPISLNFGGSSGNTYQFDVEVDASVPFWHKYDYIDLFFTLRCTSVDSISASLGNVAVPFTSSVLNANGDSWYNVSTSTSTGGITNNNIRHFTYVIRLDTRGLNRVSDDILNVKFNISCATNNSYNAITFDSVTGYLDSSNLETIPFLLQKLAISLDDWFSALGVNLTNNFNALKSNLDNNFTSLKSNISIGLTALGNNIYDDFIDLTSNLRSWFTTQFDKFDQLINGSTESNQAAEDFQDEAAVQDQQMQDMIDVMDSVEKPDPGDINMDLGSVVDSSTIMLATNGISAALGNEIILKLLIMAMTFALIGFVLYGKR